jgi:tetraacyldisaccharide 4'-kinase
VTRPDPRDRLFRSAWLRAAAVPLSWIYGAAIAARPHSNSVRVAGRVIAIGNIHAGGTGKTPLVIAVARHLASRGRKVAVVSRGYGGSLSATGAQVASSSRASEVGDEPLEIHAALRDVPVFIGADRVEAARRALADARVLVLDDAFQHVRLERDLDVVVIPAAARPENQRLLPWGRLREPLSALARADALVVVRECAAGSGGAAGAADEPLDYSRWTDARVFRAERVLDGVRPYPGTVEPVVLLGRNVVAVSGVAGPERFHRAIESAGARVVEVVAKRDHAPFTDADLALVKRLIEAHDGIAVMTGKDAARLGGRSLPFPAAILSTRIDAPEFLAFASQCVEGA